MSAADHLVTLITRADCHLCDDARAALLHLAAELGFGVAELDVDADPALLADHAEHVPVILIDGREHGYWRVDPARLRKALE